MRQYGKSHFFIAIALGILCPLLPAADDAPPPVERAGWKLVWSDEFDTDGAPDPKKWGYEVGYLRNNELQCYMKDCPENARVEKGVLVIEARKEHVKNPAYKEGAKGNEGREWAEVTSASLTTRNIASWTYGRIEARAKVPGGRGTWPAIWMLGTNIGPVPWPKCGEIDIMEYVGFDADGIHTTVHTQAYNHMRKTQKGQRIAVPNVTEEFHIFACEWTAEEIAFFVDEKKVLTFKNEHTGVETWPFDKPEYLILNLAIGGAWGGAKGIDEKIYPSKFSIDYVRIYEAAPVPEH